jgi:uroporphyrinogen-III synthase
MRKLLLLRPEPGLSASAQRAQEMGLDVIVCPLFEIVPIPWEAPNPADYDAMLLTSANAIRHGRPALKSLKSLPVHAVGQATAAAARESGFRVETVGDRDAAVLLAKLSPSLRLLHLAGEDHRDIGDARIDRHIIYRSAAIADPQLPPLEGLVAAIHSPRAGARLAALAGNRSQTAIAAISAAAAKACGGGWERIETAVEPSDKSLLALAAMLCHTSPPR